MQPLVTRQSQNKPSIHRFRISKALTFHQDRRGRTCVGETWNHFRCHAILCHPVVACTSFPSPEWSESNITLKNNSFYSKLTSSSLNQLRLSDISTNQQSLEPLMNEMLLMDNHPLRITCTPRFFLVVCPWDAFASALNCFHYWSWKKNFIR